MFRVTASFFLALAMVSSKNPSKSETATIWTGRFAIGLVIISWILEQQYPVLIWNQAIRTSTALALMIYALCFIALACRYLGRDQEGGYGAQITYVLFRVLKIFGIPLLVMLILLGIAVVVLMLNGYHFSANPQP